MFRLSDAELHVLEELWKLIQTGQTTQGVQTEAEITTPPSLLRSQLIEPPIDSALQISATRFKDRN